ncbi:DUF983 domain-containing protein [Sphingomicrobium astaxanthinifaciens]|uniref:DUF983 domain-containing protein n=1 Tax=Sphingomicrobium astaxanthinifaciens TaxID=1227949 RepID=UPI001FCC0894|nr:DUF983 domain-containing protein [Sphingomicrobium astaxanthinifaciens]MCJ7421026.1 DUF983 domain-containing protein [Sphingomicrobium astaxanthinifaciens]
MSGAAGARPITRHEAPGLARASLGGRCPRCGAKTLFEGLLTFAKRCPACGLGIGEYNVGDGPAAFLILILGTVIGAAAIGLELALAPAWYVHLVWVPLVIGLAILGLRLGKAAMLFQEVRNEAREGRLSR